MRISLINLNLIGQDAVGKNIIDQVRFFQRRGDDVRVYVLYPPAGVSAEVTAITQTVTLTDLLSRRDAHFTGSDLYVYHYPGYYSLLDTIRYLERGAIIFYFHNVTPPELWNRSEERAQMQSSVEAVGKLAAYADLIVADSAFNAEDLIQQHGCDPARIRTLPLAVELDRFQPGPASPQWLEQYKLHGKRPILYVGRMASNKRVDLLVEALPTIKQTIPNATLLLVGDTSGNPAFVPVVEQIRRRAAELGIASDVTFTGRVDDLPAYYRLASLYASASLHEGFGVPLLEAMASGVPVVVSNATAHPWVLGEAGLLAEPGDANDLAKQIVRVLSDDRLYGDLVQRGLLRAKEFSLEAYYGKWMEIVAEATQWLPKRPYPFATLRSAAQSANQTDANAGKDRNQQESAIPSDLADDLEHLGNAAEVMIKNYQVRSTLPIFGSWLAWLRRNLTSHLREPYLDPMFRKQEAFNWMTVHTMRHIIKRLPTGSSLSTTGALPDSTSPTSVDSARITRLEAEIVHLQAEVEQLRKVNTANSQ